MKNLWMEIKLTIELAKDILKYFDNQPEHQETRNEEIFSSLTHAFGAGLSTAALVILVVFSSLYGDIWQIISFTVFGVTLVLLYLSSTFYHIFRNQEIKRLFRIFDHCSIYLLIAGTYTPFTLVVLKGAWGWTMFGIIWTIAIIGVAFKIFFVGKFDLISTIIYLAMGWLVVIAIGPIYENLVFGGLALTFAGGLFYSLGIIFYLWDNLPYNHAIWHLFVLGGSICHFFAMVIYVLPMKNAS